MKYEEDERIRQLCKNVFSAASDEAFQAALQELRDEVSGSVTRARERGLSRWADASQQRHFRYY
jgi:hypothetical protein